jgi:hypothetical protein
MTNIWDYVSSITETKKKLEIEKAYNTFMINRALSYFADTLFFANEMNKWWRNVDNDQHYDYLRYAIRAKRRRSGKWAKRSTDINLEAVMKFYGYGRREAADAMSVMDSEHIEMIKQDLESRGIK